MLPGDPGWDDARSAFNLLLDQQPAAVAFPADAEDVATAVAYARAAGLRVAPQATGHNQGPLGGLENTLLLNVSRLAGGPASTRARSACGSARAPSGSASRRGCPRTASPACTAPRPTSAIAGYSLGGGMGWLARKYGLQANAVTALELVTADGELVRADAEHHPDLFWALRGGGGNFGVVTAIEFDVYRGRRALRGRAVLPVRALAPRCCTRGARCCRRCPTS